jgi:hypothetical protein
MISSSYASKATQRNRRLWNGVSSACSQLRYRMFDIEAIESIRHPCDVVNELIREVRQSRWSSRRRAITD